MTQTSKFHIQRLTKMSAASRRCNLFKESCAVASSQNFAKRLRAISETGERERVAFLSTFTLQDTGARIVHKSQPGL